MAKKKRYTVGNPGGEWVVWEQTPELRWIAKCRGPTVARKIARALNRRREAFPCY